MKKLCGVLLAALAGALDLFAAEADLAGCFPPEIRTVGIVMPASILAKERFDAGVSALRKAGYRVKLAPRLSFDRLAPLADRVADFEETWLDPEVDLVLCARGGTGAQDVIKRLDWRKLATRPDQRVLGFSNITMILNAMLKKGVGHPFSGPTLGRFLSSTGDTLDWLSRALAGKPLPPTQLRALRPGAFSGLPCGGHTALVRLGIRDGWAADARGRVVFLERNNSTTVEGIRAELDEIAASGFLDGAAGVVFGDITPGSGKKSRALPPGELKLAREEVEAVKRAFADKVKCPVYDGYAYGHVTLSHAIDFRRKVSVSSDGLMTWADGAAAEAPYAFRKRLECVHEPNRRDASLAPAPDEFAFADGCAVPDADFADYLRVSMGVRAKVGRPEGGRVEESVDPSLREREYVVAVTKDGVSIRAYDERALHQAYYHLEGLMNLRGAPFLKFGTERRRMRFSPRMIHSGYACDVFPDSYLKLIAHHGFDAIVFYIKDIDRTAAGPDQDVNGLIERARKAGLDTYLYSSVSCFAHPDDPKGRAEIEASFGRIAKAHPGAKGIVFVGESCQFPSKDPRVQPVRHRDKNHDDPRPLAGWFPCRDYPDWLRAVMDVLHRHSPKMEIVFWTYNWSRQDAKVCADLIPHFPDGVAIQGTLGNGAVTEHDNGLVCTCRDYTVSTPGFTPHYAAQAAAAKSAGRRFYTMANTAGLTWDYGTAPYLPCPFQWKRRWDGLVDPRYGIAGLMETHHYGWYPSFVSELAKEAYTEGGMPFDEHLRKIAARDFGAANADRVVEAWRKWSQTEVDYVANNENQYGPFRIGPAFPYNFGGRKVRHADFPQDRKAYHTMRWMAILNFPFDLEQAREQNIAYSEIGDGYRRKQLELFKRMRRDWTEGLELLRSALGDCARTAAGAGHRAGRREKAEEMIRVGEWHLHAVETAINLNRGYLAFKTGDRAGVLKYARAEYANAKAALRLAERDSRLGWEPSMEYAAGPEQIRWKLSLMKSLYGPLD